eukprot:scaffold6079_cov163-Isochrysis_galbana.AAC.1
MTQKGPMLQVSCTTIEQHRGWGDDTKGANAAGGQARRAGLDPASLQEKEDLEEGGGRRAPCGAIRGEGMQSLWCNVFWTDPYRLFPNKEVCPSPRPPNVTDLT